MKRNLVRSIILVTIFSLCMASPAAAAKSYAADRYDVDILIQPDGSLNITETIVFRFEGDPFTYVFRELAFNNLDSIDGLQASLDGQVLPAGTQPGQVEISRGKPIRVTWHFAPASGSSHEFMLNYRVLGAIRQDGSADSLIWRAIPEDHEYTIASSTIRVTYPAGAAPTSEPALSGPPAEIETSAQGAVFTCGQIGENEAVEVTLRFPAGSLVSQPPAWQAAQAEAKQRTQAAVPFGFGAAVLVGLLGILGILRVSRAFERSDAIISETPYNLSAPPQPIPPGLAAKLAGGDTGFLGTLFDLARRGTLTIEEGPKGMLGGRSFEIKRQNTFEPLHPHEKAFLETLFKKGDSVPLKTIANLATSSEYKKAVEDESVAQGWLDLERKAGRSRYMIYSVLGFMAGIALAVVGLVLLNTSPLPGALSGILIGGGAALAVMGFISMITAGVISPLTPSGVSQAAAWKGYSNYLRQVTRGKEPLAAVNAFDTYLPYAAAFGLATEWARYFQRQLEVPVPAWFHGLQTSMDDGGFAAIMAAVSSADSSSSAASGGAAGASGGGSSGAG